MRQLTNNDMNVIGGLALWTLSLAAIVGFIALMLFVDIGGTGVVPHALSVIQGFGYTAVALEAFGILATALHFLGIAQIKYSDREEDALQQPRSGAGSTAAAAGVAQFIEAQQPALAGAGLGAAAAAQFIRPQQTTLAGAGLGAAAAAAEADVGVGVGAAAAAAAAVNSRFNGVSAAY